MTRIREEEEDPPPSMPCTATTLHQLCRQIHQSCSPSSNADIVVQLLPDLAHVSSPVGASTASREEQNYLWASVAVGKQR